MKFDKNNLESYLKDEKYYEVVKILEESDKLLKLIDTVIFSIINSEVYPLITDLDDDCYNTLVVIINNMIPVTLSYSGELDKAIDAINAYFCSVDCTELEQTGDLLKSDDWCLFVNEFSAGEPTTAILEKLFGHLYGLTSDHFRKEWSRSIMSLYYDALENAYTNKE